MPRISPGPTVRLTSSSASVSPKRWPIRSSSGGASLSPPPGRARPDRDSASGGTWKSRGVAQAHAAFGLEQVDGGVRDRDAHDVTFAPGTPHSTSTASLGMPVPDSSTSTTSLSLGALEEHGTRQPTSTVAAGAVSRRCSGECPRRPGLRHARRPACVRARGDRRDLGAVSAQDGSARRRVHSRASGRRRGARPPGRRFIGGSPMNCATNRLAGRS